jgi:hypothetical protein
LAPNAFRLRSILRSLFTSIPVVSHEFRSPSPSESCCVVAKAAVEEMEDTPVDKIKRDTSIEKITLNLSSVFPTLRSECSDNCRLSSYSFKKIYHEEFD